MSPNSQPFHRLRQSGGSQVVPHSSPHQIYCFPFTRNSHRFIETREHWLRAMTIHSHQCMVPTTHVTKESGKSKRNGLLGSKQIVMAYAPDISTQTATKRRLRNPTVHPPSSTYLLTDNLEDNQAGGSCMEARDDETPPHPMGTTSMCASAAQSELSSTISNSNAMATTIQRDLESFGIHSLRAAHKEFNCRVDEIMRQVRDI